MTRLWYQNRSFALGQRADTVIKQLRETIGQLVLNSDIEKRVEQYTELHKQLLNDERIDELSNNIEYLFEYIDGGQVLAGYGACDLCPPPNISP